MKLTLLIQIKEKRLNKTSLGLVGYLIHVTFDSLDSSSEIICLFNYAQHMQFCLIIASFPAKTKRDSKTFCSYVFASRIAPLPSVIIQDPPHFKWA